MARNGIYEKLTSDPGDLVGILAYIAYKQHKIEFCQITADGNPSSEQVEQFQAVAAMETSLAHYRTQAGAMVQVFISAGLNKIAEQAEAEAREDALFHHLRQVQANLSSELQTINASIVSKRTLLGWLRDVGANLLVNLVTILMIGTLVLGYQSYTRMQQDTESKVGLHTPDAEDSTLQSADTSKPNGPRTDRTRADSGHTQQ